MLCFVVAFALLVAGSSSMTIEERIKKLEEEHFKASRQVWTQQLFAQEEMRSIGDSGFITSRLDRVGTKNYYSTSHLRSGYMSMHEHSNYDRTIGLGEMSLIMNGVQFRTRHNDYKLRMPNPESSTYRSMRNIPFPPAPKDVTDKPTTEEEIQEMREYFKAFATSNITHRDYRNYFRATLCYMEGAWTKVSKNLDEPFKSDRHHIDATSWFDLREKIIFTSYTGSKSILENYAYLPTMIYKVHDGIPQYAQWNYRILCHPLKTHVPLSALILADDLLGRVPTGKSQEDAITQQTARFMIRESDYDQYTGPDSLLDKVMNEIPGADNYQANLRDESFGMKYLKPGTMEELNTGFYHRYYKIKNEDGTYSTNLRGFNDANLWVAQTSHDKIAGKEVITCKNSSSTCSKVNIGYTYALPLEVIYMTPLMSWNPYNLREAKKRPERKKDEMPGDVYDITARHTRSGGRNESTAFLGYNSRSFYKTPQEFYEGKDRKDKEDTGKRGVGVLDADGKLRFTTTAGSRIMTQNIPEVGRVRLRYPIMPLHGEGSSAWKELNALRELVMNQRTHSNLYNRPPCQCTAKILKRHGKDPVQIMLSKSTVDAGNEHSHTFWLAPEQWKDIAQNNTIRVITSAFEEHSHELEITTNEQREPIILKCDGRPRCPDGHSNYLIRME